MQVQQNTCVNTNRQRDAVQRLGLTAEDVAAVLSVSPRHIWKLNATGAIPAPIRLGRAVRWRADELRAWLAAGCPSREAWEARAGGER